MAFSPDELEQIRDVVRAETGPRRSRMGLGTIIFLIFVAIFVSILALHVLVIGGFTVYHLMHPSS